MQMLTKITVVLAAVAVGLGLAPCTVGAGGGGGTVAGPCGAIASVSVSPVQLSAAGVARPVEFRGNASNCSIYLQSYWIEFDEPTNTGSCGVAFSLFNALLVDSGSTRGWTASTSLSGMVSPSACVGLHTVRAVLRSRTDGRVLSTSTVTYSVTVK
jgi:hypothetical protein